MKARVKAFCLWLSYDYKSKTNGQIIEWQTTKSIKCNVQLVVISLLATFCSSEIMSQPLFTLQ